jgi:hypothetical protein
VTADYVDAPGGIDIQSGGKVLPDTGIQAQLTGEAAAYQGPGSRWEQLKERADWNFFESAPGAAMVRRVLEFGTAETARLAGSKKWDVEQLKEFYPGYAWTYAEYPEVAAMRIAQRQKERKNLEYVSRGQPWGMGWELLSGVPQVLDPINIGAGYGMGKLLGPLLSKLPLSKFSSKLIEDFSGNLAADIPTFQQNQKDFSDQTPAEMVVGSLVGAGLSASMHAAISAVTTRKALKKAQADIIKDQNLTTAMAQHEMGAKISELGPVRFAGDAFINGEINPNVNLPRGTMDFLPVDHPSEAPFFAPVREGDMKTVGEHGEAVYLTDSAYERNNYGDFAEVKIDKDAKFLDLGKTLDDNDAKVFKMAVEMKLDRFGIKDIELPEGMTLKDLQRRLEIEEDAGNLPDGITAIGAMRDTAQELGYSGFTDVHKVNGNPRYNKVTLFDTAKLEKTQDFLQNSAYVPKADPAELANVHDQYAKNIRNMSAYDEKIIATLDSIKSKPEMTPEQVKTFLKEQEVRTRADLRKLVAQSEQVQQMLDLGAQQEMKFSDAVSRLTDEDLSKMMQTEMGLRAGGKLPEFRRSRLPGKDLSFREKIDSYRTGLRESFGEQGDMFLQFARQLELDLPPGKQGIFTPTDITGVQGELALGVSRVDIEAPKATPPEAPTPQTLAPMGDRMATEQKIATPVEKTAPRVPLTPQEVKAFTETMLKPETRDLIKAEEAAIDAEFKQGAEVRKEMAQMIECFGAGIV